MKNIIILVLVLIICFQLHSQNNISGIVNDYSEVTGISQDKSQLVVADIQIFEVGDLILIIQMKGAIIDTNNHPTFGQIIDYKESGNFEFNWINSISNGMITLDHELCSDYDINGLVQLVKVPQYTNAIVSGILTASPWNGLTGGILAFKVNETLTLSSNIDVSGLGFRGGKINNTKWECDQMDYFYNHPSWQGAQKGEGIAVLGSDKMAGRGALANGGGGGNCTNAGGAGGGNYGMGGHGGKQFYFFCDSIQIGGLPGNSVACYDSLNKIFLGGGGGAGHENDNAGTNGTNGAGIIVIQAGKIEGNGYSISANGLNASASENDAAGGGGSGGAILIDCYDFGSTPINISAIGGKGGNCNVGPYLHCYGTGGGGGGGCILLSLDQLPQNVSVYLQGGNNGIINNSDSPCHLSNYGALPGGDGDILFNLSLDQCCDESAFEYDDFKYINNINFIGDAHKTDSNIVITQSEQWKGGAVWYADKVPLKKGFTTEFSFRFSDGEDKYIPEDYPGADGIAFVIQNHKNDDLGSLGGGLGYSKIPNSFAVEFDTYKNTSDIADNFNDPNENHIAVFCNGIYPNTPDHSSSANIVTNSNIMPLVPDGRIFYSKIEYIKDRYMKIYLDSNNQFENPPVIEIPNIDLSKMIELDSEEFSWIGFTASTGNAHEKHELLSWMVCPKPTNAVYVDVIEDNSLIGNEIKIYPNPANDILNIEFDSHSYSLVSIELFSVLGRRYYESESKYKGLIIKQIPVSELSDGIYFIVIKINGIVYRRTFFIIR
jgi:hypothetical protein